MIGILEQGSEEMDEALSQQSGYLFRYRNIEKNCGADMKVDVNFIFLHLDKFDKSETESQSLLDQFAYALKHMKQATASLTNPTVSIRRSTYRQSEMQLT